jgi:hypothetical protein
MTSVTSVKKQCIAIKKDGLRCSRFAGVNSDYCWQHEKNSVQQREIKSNITDASDISSEILNLGLPPELASGILTYGDIYTSSHKVVQNYITKEKVNILREWCNRIGVRTQWSDIATSQYEYLWGIFEKRINDYPDPDVFPYFRFG